MLDMLLSYQLDANTIMNYIFIAAFLLNLVFVFTIIFMERRSAGSIWAWILVLGLMPLIGFIVYLLFGRQIQRKSIFKLDDKDRIGLERIVNQQLSLLKKGEFGRDNPHIQNYSNLIQMLLYNNAAFYTNNNDIDLLTDGHTKFEQLKKDIREAQSYIHIQYYIFRNDQLGESILELLEQKLDEGLEVKMLYDDMGSRSLTLRDFKLFKEKGGKVEAFFPSKLPLINLRMNNRNHRKIVVIDGVIGYVGGFNVGKEYLGLSKKFGYWRDTHLRITGEAVNALQLRFILDWNSQAHRDNIEYHDKYFPDNTSGKSGNIGVQIASSGPDESWEQIKYGYLKMISMAKKDIFIQTPYFVPDEAFMDALKIAALGGINVNIMIPCKPDHPFVYWATYKNVASLLEAGAKVYLYDNGFLHAKTLTIDDEITSVGTTNMDHRSFTLNFEVNAFVYNEHLAKKVRQSFENDLKVCTELTIEKYQARGLWIKFKESISQLLSPIL
ncbi:cardiolipin synthase [Staphylococcus felis]|uniref:Cardiolipin synthase n=1 Tax=Staphylococcus felis TaxID=46127 RepID=A0A2K3ZJS8_9STAP|nr:cardiolipin synthase [Staphylococcus felis]AVP35461.1 cardiolipin synthase [Staphylococcus felis]MBH9581302.1 cardiolipin synthase [Staphylococcus felis]MDM8327184.1 cardiolipin synthase [Staphylococcus felis]PNZ38116.1 cardiolipin synthase [Staphylococcus felis]QQB02445.1 cardiolipin synthase [Staphylococcus felis]